MVSNQVFYILAYAICFYLHSLSLDSHQFSNWKFMLCISLTDKIIMNLFTN